MTVTRGVERPRFLARERDLRDLARRLVERVRLPLRAEYCRLSVRLAVVVEALLEVGDHAAHLAVVEVLALRVQLVARRLHRVVRLVVPLHERRVLHVRHELAALRPVLLRVAWSKYVSIRRSLRDRSNSRAAPSHTNLHAMLKRSVNTKDRQLFSVIVTGSCERRARALQVRIPLPLRGDVAALVADEPSLLAEHHAHPLTFASCGW